MITLYGISNCDTVRKARKWLDQHAPDYRFHDFRADGLERKRLQGWLAAQDATTLINRRSTSWKQLDEQQREQIGLELEQGKRYSETIKTVLDAPTLLKRPLLEVDGALVEIGFNESAYRERLR